MNSFEANRQTRRNLLKVINGLTDEQLVTIPQGFNNNILWNIGHVCVTQQALQYRLSGNPSNMPENLTNAYKKGTSASDIDVTDIHTFKKLLVSQIDDLQADYENGLFKEFTVYPTSYGITLESIDDAIQFNLLHEALHLGYVMALKRSLGQ